MEIQSNEKYTIFTPYYPVLDKKSGKDLLNKIASSEKITGIDMNCIHDCSFDFIEGLISVCNEKKVSLFNINSDIFTLFNFMNIDKIAKIYVSELDFIEDTRRLLNRKFTVI